MVKYILKRLLTMIPIFIGVAIIIFTVMELTPGEPAIRVLGHEATQAQIEQFNELHNLNKPFFERFVTYIWNVMTKLDFGISYQTSQPITKTLGERIPVTLIITLGSITFASIVGVGLGVLSAVKQYSLVDNIARGGAMVLAAVPIFWLGMLLALVFSLKLGLLPSSGIGSWKHYVLPCLSLGIPFAARIMRSTRSYMLEAIRQDYVLMARAKGLTQRQVVWNHAFANASLPIISVIGVSMGTLLGGAVITEMVFAAPGLGSFIVNNVTKGDLPCVAGGTIMLAMFFSLILLLVDIFYALVDPRIRARFTKK